MTPVTLTGPRLDTDRLILRLPQAADYAAFIAFQHSDRAAKLGWQMSALDTDRFWHSQFGHWVMRGFGWFVMERKSDGAAIGYAGIVQPDPTDEPELGWTIWDAEAEGHGYAQEAAEAVIGFARSALGLGPLRAVIAQGNTRSEALAERLGFAAGATLAKAGAPSTIWRHPAEAPA